MTTPHRHLTAPFYKWTNQGKWNQTTTVRSTIANIQHQNRTPFLFYFLIQCSLIRPSQQLFRFRLYRFLTDSPVYRVYLSNQENARNYLPTINKTEEAEKVMSDKIELEANFHNNFSVLTKSASRIHHIEPRTSLLFRKWKKEVKMERKRKIANFDAILRPTSVLDNSTYFTSATHHLTLHRRLFFTSSDDGRKILISCSWFSCFLSSASFYQIRAFLYMKK